MNLFNALKGSLRRASRRADAHDELRRLRDRLAEAQAQILDAREHKARLRERVDSLSRKLDEVRHVARAQRDEAGRYRHRVLSSSVLRDLLPARRRQVSFRAGASAAAEREQRLLACSEPYRRLVAEGPIGPLEGARRVRMDGLAWWVPVGAGDSEWAERVVAKESLPYRALLHAREVSIGGIMLDLGAHSGTTAIPRVLLGEVEACYCAEPDPLNFACLTANVIESGVRGLVLPDQVAIGAGTGRARLQRAKWSRGHQIAAAADADAAGLVEVPMRSLDDWVGQLGIDSRAISFVKSDIQGYELQMLQGAPRLLAQPHIAWQIEIAPKLLRAAGGELRELIAMLQRHFTYFIDLHPTASGRRRCPVGDLSTALEYLGDAGYTDIIVYAASPGPVEGGVSS